MKHPQEIEVWYVIPAVRKELAADLVKRGKSQREVAKILGITEAAVSQYVKKKRAGLELPNEVKEFVKKCAAKVEDKESAFRQIQVVCKFIKDNKHLCKIHRCVEDCGKKCDACY